MTEPNPATFGPYRLLEPIGEGGMGRVWKAMDLNLERVVALKVLKGADEQRRKALIQEAKTACQLNHPNIAVVFEAGEVEGAPFIAMELVEGRSLKDYVGTEMAEADLREILLQAASGLQHAHQKGVVHRDIKPENLLVTESGSLKILDFGVAKRSLPHAKDTTSSGYTVTEETALGISVGTPAYMSPEQAYGLPLGPGTDQFSLGTVLFELAAGRHPFRKENLLDTLHAIAKDDPPALGELRQDLSATFQETLRRMLQKRAEDRFASFQSLLAFLESEGQTRSTGRVPTLAVPKLPRKARGIVGLVALALLVLLGAGWWLHSRFASDPRLGRGRKVVAILPVEMLGMGAEVQWMGTSLQDAMATGLLKRSELLVLDRVRVAEALAKVGSGADRVRGLARELKAEYLLLGTLQAAGDRMRLSLRMVDGRGGEIINSLSVQGEMARPLRLEEELLLHLPQLVGAPEQGSGPAPAASRARSTRTRELYARSIELLDEGRLESYEKAIQLLEEAAAGEPGYAPVRAGLARALLELGAWETHLGRPEARTHSTRAVEEARKAVGLDPGFAPGHRVLGQALLRIGDLDGAHRESQAAVDMDPGDFRAWTALADSYAYADDPEGRDQARTHYLRALELHPADWWANFRLATLMQNDGELAQALRYADRARALNPGAEYAHLTAGVCLFWMGKYPEAAKRLEEGIQGSPNSGLLRVTQALLDYAAQDAAGFRTREASLAGSWPEDHPVNVLLKGLRDSIDGNPQAMEDRFRAFAAASARRSLASLSTGERRTASVNTYHMARALAQAGRKEAARILLAEADRLHQGKLKVAAADPAMKGI